MAGNLEGKVALVTGAASGMGRVMAKSLAASGATIAAFDVNVGNLMSLTREPEFAGSALLTIAGDVSQTADCRRAVEETVQAFGSLDILINCAGISLVPIMPQGHKGPLRFWETDPEGWKKVHGINNVGAFQMAHFAVRPMMAKGWGRIVNITTSFDTMLAANFSPYGSAKAALEAATVAWAKELAGTGVTVNILVPGGPTNTPFLPEETRSHPGLVQPEVMGLPIAWLASPASDGITGRRFIARDWDAALTPAAAAEKCGAPAAWAEMAARAAATRGFGSTTE